MPVVCTIGYHGHSPESLVALLKRHRVRRVVDVRWNPVSRKPGFGRQQLQDGLRSGGIAYEHIRELGVPPEIRGRTIHRGDVAGLRRYVRQRTSRHVRRFLELPRIRPGYDCLLCVEANPSECHRSIISRHLATKYGFTVRHL